MSHPPPAGGTSEPSSRRRGGRHPDASQVDVRLTDPAVEDLHRLARTNTEAVRWAVKKLLLLSRDPEAGVPLHKELAGWRKLVVGDRDWRVIWRVTFDDSGNTIVDIAEVWAVGARSDGEVYDEMRSRVASLPQNPATIPLRDLVDRFEKVIGELEIPDPPVIEPIPDWLRERLCAIHVAEAQIDAMTPQEAMALLEKYWSRPH